MTIAESTVVANAIHYFTGEGVAAAVAVNPVNGNFTVAVLDTDAGMVVGFQTHVPTEADAIAYAKKAVV